MTLKHLWQAHLINCALHFGVYCSISDARHLDACPSRRLANVGYGLIDYASFFAFIMI
ncbi:hypothetical protein FHU13_002343 [Methylobacterium sp. R2-1]|nr:hypothetical protein [Methylobacterium sp. R2-1]